MLSLIRLSNGDGLCVPTHMFPELDTKLFLVCHVSWFIMRWLCSAEIQYVVHECHDVVIEMAMSSNGCVAVWLRGRHGTPAKHPLNTACLTYHIVHSNASDCNIKQVSTTTTTTTTTATTT